MGTDIKISQILFSQKKMKLNMIKPKMISQNLIGQILISQKKIKPNLIGMNLIKLNMLRQILIGQILTKLTFEYQILMGKEYDKSELV